jgi:formate dehydrogenase maturation protein FdhE
VNSEGASPGLHAALHAGWERRIERARHLAATSSSAADVLTFYATLAEYQQSLLRLVPDSPPPHVATRIQYEEPSVADAIEIDVVLSALPDFLLWLQATAPTPLANAAAQMRHSDAEHRRSLVYSYLFDRRQHVGDADEAAAFVVEALLQPFAEWSATWLRKSAAGGSSAEKGSAAGTETRELINHEGHEGHEDS